MLPERETHRVEIEGVVRELPLFEVAPGLRIAVLNILGDTELVEACAGALSKKLDQYDYDLFVTAEAKSIPLVQAMAMNCGKRYIVLRKNFKPYMGETLEVETVSITTGKPQTLYMDEKDRTLVKAKKVILVDDVISTGSTLAGMRSLIQQAQGEVVAEAAVFTEGEPGDWSDVVALGHLPLFRE
jgi:adenine phosphoribosyltransferase